MQGPRRTGPCLSFQAVDGRVTLFVAGRDLPQAARRRPGGQRRRHNRRGGKHRRPPGKTKTNTRRTVPFSEEFLARLQEMKPLAQCDRIKEETSRQ